MASFTVFLAAVVITAMVGPEEASAFRLPERDYGRLQSYRSGRYRTRRPYSWWWRLFSDEAFDDKDPAPLSASDPNVCVKPLSQFGRGCIDLRGRRKYLETEYICCPGFKRVPGKAGCPEEKYTSTKNIPEVAEELGLNQFLKYAGKTGVAKLLRGKGPYTVFIATDKAFAELPKTTREQMKREKWARYLMHYHVVQGKHIAENLTNGMNLSSHEFKELLRISSRHNRKILLVEGANVSTTNQGASNGIIHVIDRVLTPPRLTISEILERDQERRFTTLLRALASTSLNLTGQRTLFAPTDKAFEKLPKGTIEKLLANKACLEALLKNHITRGYVFSNLLQPSRRFYTCMSLERNRLCIERNSSGHMMINEKEVIEKDLRARDGVVHVIDDVLVPTTAMDVVMLARHLELTELSKLLKAFGFAEKLEGKDFTIFAPTNDAFEKLSNETKAKLAQNPQKLMKILEYHVVQGMVMTKNLKNDQMLTSLDTPNKLRINTYTRGRRITVQGSRLRKHDIHGCNIIIHVIDDVLVPVEHNLLQIVENDPRLGIFRSMLTNTSIEAMLNSSEPFTVFAPTDKAIAKLSQAKITELLSDSNKREALIEQHIARGSVYSSSVAFSRFDWNPFCRRIYPNNLRSNTLEFKKCSYEDLVIEGIKVSTSDISATNGVLHVIDGVIVQDKKTEYYWKKPWWRDSRPSKRRFRPFIFERGFRG